MPYKNIVFIKLFLDLFDGDDRFLYQLNESQQLLYLKLLYMAGRTENKIPKNIKYVCHKINYAHDEDCFKADIKRIKDIFSKFKEYDEYFSFEKFRELHNRTNDFVVGNSKGTPKELQRVIPNEKEKKIKGKEDSAVVEIKDFFCLTYQKKQGVDYIHHYGKEEKILKDLLKKIDPAELRELIVRFFESKDKFIQESGYTIGVFKSQINKLRVVKSERKVRPL